MLVRRTMLGCCGAQAENPPEQEGADAPAAALLELLGGEFTKADSSSVTFHEAFPASNTDLVVGILFSEGEEGWGEANPHRGETFFESTTLLQFYELVNSKGKKFEVVMNTRGNQELDLIRKADMLNLRIHDADNKDKPSDAENSSPTRPIPWLMIPIDNPKYSERHKINYDSYNNVPFPQLFIFSKTGKRILSNTGGDYGLEEFHNDDMLGCLRAADAQAACLALHANWLEKIKEADES